MVTNSPQNSLFRQEALKKSASPERLDQLIQIIDPKRWLTLVALGTLVSAGAAWSVLGQIPIKVEGRGILVYPSQVTPLQTDISGRIKTVLLKPGDTVEKGKPIALIDQSELRRQLELAQNRLSQLSSQNATAIALQQQRESIEQSVLTQQRQSLQTRLVSEQALPDLMKLRATASIDQERRELEAQLSTLNTLLPTYQERWEAREAIAESGAISKDQILTAKREFQDIEAQINQLETQLSQLDLRVADVEQEYVINQNQFLELKSQLKELDSRSVNQTEQDKLAEVNRRKEIQDAEREVARIGAQLQQNETMLSAHDGEILEMNIQPGQLVEPGQAVAVVSQLKGEQKLLSINFFPVGEGQKIETNSDLQVTPSTVKREEFGGIVGRVSRVSSYPITREGAASLVGNPELLKDVMGDGSQIAVFAELETSAENESGFAWSSSQGPEQPVESGVTTSVRVTIAKRSPISFVLPILKDWIGFSS